MAWKYSFGGFDLMICWFATWIWLTIFQRWQRWQRRWTTPCRAFQCLWSSIWPQKRRLRLPTISQVILQLSLAMASYSWAKCILWRHSTCILRLPTIPNMAISMMSICKWALCTLWLCGKDKDILDPEFLPAEARVVKVPGGMQSESQYWLVVWNILYFPIYWE